MHTLVLLRHGESVWNQENRFTGWVDVGLSELGVQEAVQAGRILLEEGYTFDVAFTSVLKRSIKTLWIVLEEMDLMWIPVHRSWRLNERHYGALQGLNKEETTARHGEEQVLTWRRSYDVRPPPLGPIDATSPARDPRYGGLRPEEIPLTESLQDVLHRLLPYWEQTMGPAARDGLRALICAHGNSLRALVKQLDAISDEDVADLNIPTGIPLVYELGDDLRPIRHSYVGDQEAAQRKAQAVAEQARAQP